MMTFPGTKLAKLIRGICTNQGAVVSFAVLEVPGSAHDSIICNTWPRRLSEVSSTQSATDNVAPGTVDQARHALPLHTTDAIQRNTRGKYSC